MNKRVLLVISSFLMLFGFSCAKKPVACFTFSKTIVKVGDTIQLVNCSTNFTDIRWDLPLGATTSIVSPRVKMQNAGNYTVQLTVGLDNFNEQNTATNSITVLP
jgi:PKD repeat protein